MKTRRKVHLYLLHFFIFVLSSSLHSTPFFFNRKSPKCMWNVKVDFGYVVWRR